MPVNVTLRITLYASEEQTQLKSSMLRGISYVRAYKLPGFWSMVRYNIWVMEIAGGTWFNYAGCFYYYNCYINREANPYTA